MTDPITQAHQAAARINAVPDNHRQALAHARAAIDRDTTRSDDYKHQQLANWQQDAAARGYEAVAGAWQDFTRAQQAAERAVTRAAQQAAERFDHARIDALARDYTSQLATANRDPQIGRTQVVATAQRLYDQAQATQDPNTLRAWRIAAGPALTGLDRGDSTDAHTARHLLDRAAELIDAERGDTPAREQDLEAIRGMRPHVRTAVLRAEHAITGAAPPNILVGQLTDWQQRILGETISDHGGGVVLRGAVPGAIA